MIKLSLSPYKAKQAELLEKSQILFITQLSRADV